MRNKMQNKQLEFWKKESWYLSLQDDGKCISDQIYKHHEYFKKQDVKYKRIVCIYKVVILFLAFVGTIVFGLRGIIPSNVQIVIGLVDSSLITLLTALISYFNFEEYWRRNIKIHIELNMIRDQFCLEAVSGKVDENRIQYYKKRLDKIQNKNIAYWERNIKDN